MVLSDGFWVEAALGAWGLFALLFVLRVVGSAVYLCWLKRTSGEPGERLEERRRHWLRLAGPGRDAQVRISEGISTPMVAGLVRPMILFPAALAQRLSDEEIDHAGLHEMAHIRRWDDWVNLAQKLVEAVWFFHPAVWWAGRELSLMREMACDEWVISRPVEPKAYASCLTRLLELSRSGGVPVLAAGAVRGRWQISKRIEALLDHGKVPGPRISMRAFLRGTLVVMAAVAACAAMVPLIELAQERENLARLNDEGWQERIEQTSRAEEDIEERLREDEHRLDEQRRLAEEREQQVEELRTRDDQKSAQNPAAIPSAPEAPGDEEKRRAEADERRERLEQQRREREEARARQREQREQLRQEELQRRQQERDRRREEARRFPAGDSDQRISPWRSIHHDRSGDRVHLKYSSLWNSLEFEITGQVEFTDDDRDVKELVSGASLTISERRGLVIRTIRVKGASDGGIERSFYVNGEKRPFGEQARRMMADLLPDLIRESGAGAPGRVRRILGKRGAAGVLEEIRRIRGDGVQRIYFEELLTAGSLGAGDMRELLRQVAYALSSDAEKGRVLARVAESHLQDATLIAPYLSAASTISSDSEHRRALTVLLDRPLPASARAEVCRNARQISSDSERARLLIEFAERQAIEGSVAGAYFRAVEGISSDSEKRRVLAVLLRPMRPSGEIVRHLVRAAGTISSDSEKGTVLTAAAQAADGEPPQVAIVRAAGTISSDSEHRRVLTAVLETKSGRAKQPVIEVLRSVRAISSDAEKRRALERAADVCPDDDAVFEEYLAALNTIGSRGEYTRAWSALAAREDIGKRLRTTASADGRTAFRPRADRGPVAGTNQR